MDSKKVQELLAKATTMLDTDYDHRVGNTRDFVVSALHDIAAPSHISQSGIGSCGSTCVQTQLAIRNPAKYLDVLNTLAKNKDYGIDRRLSMVGDNKDTVTEEGKKIFTSPPKSPLDNTDPVVTKNKINKSINENMSAQDRTKFLDSFTVKQKIEMINAIFIGSKENPSPEDKKAILRILENIFQGNPVQNAQAMVSLSKSGTNPAMLVYILSQVKSDDKLFSQVVANVIAITDPKELKNTYKKLIETDKSVNYPDSTASVLATICSQLKDPKVSDKTKESLREVLKDIKKSSDQAGNWDKVKAEVDKLGANLNDYIENELAGKGNNILNLLK